MASSDCHTQLGDLPQLQEIPILTFGVIADVQHADVEDGYNYTKTSRRYYRTALDMLQKAMDAWNNNRVKKPAFLLQLGDIIDGKCKTFSGKNISDKCLTSVLEKFSQFIGPIYHIWGNHEFYNFSRDKLMNGSIYAGNQIHCKPVKNKGYYSAEPHRHLVILALDCYEVSILGCEQGTEGYKKAEKYLEVNKNADKNDPSGLIGDNRRFVKYNGGVSKEQLEWLRSCLEEARRKQQNVIVIGHCGVYEPATDPSCLVWNYSDILDILQQYKDCVLCYFAGHDHGGGRAVDPTRILHLTFPGVLENNVDCDFATVYMYADRLEFKGNGRVPNLKVRLKFPIDTRHSI